MFEGFDIGKDLQDAFNDGYNQGFDDVVKIIEDYKDKDRISSQHKILIECLLKEIMATNKNTYNRQ